MKKTHSFYLLENKKDWVCVWKRSNTLSVPSRMADRDPRLCVGIELQKFLEQQIYPVHRLDFEVSGILIFAKNPKAQSLLNHAFEKRLVHKIYRALSYSQPKEVPLPLLELKENFFKESRSQNNCEWECLLSEGKRRSFPAAHGKPSFTRARIVRKLNTLESNDLLNLGEEIDLWELEPISGRRHQLRLHMCLAQNPIIGDVLYSGQGWKNEGIALCAKELNFKEVLNREQIELPEILTFDVSKFAKNSHWTHL